MIHVDIIVGFLGAGKTTLINKLLAEAYPGERPVLIENEFGAVGIDDSLIEKPEVQVRLISSGCICCTLTSDFVTGIIEIAEAYHPTRIIVEPTGLAYPEDVLRACEEAAKHVSLKVSSLITVVNPENILALLTVGGALFKTQISEAELIVLSRTQLSDPVRLYAVKQAIRKLNAHCPMIEENWENLDALTLLSLAETLRAEKSGCDCCHGHAHEEDCHCHEHGADCHHHEDEAHFSSLAFFPEHSFTKRRAQALLAALPEGGCGDILRAKGFLKNPEGGFFRADYVYGSGELRDVRYGGKPKFVVIGRNLNEEAISDLLGGVQEK